MKKAELARTTIKRLSKFYASHTTHLARVTRRASEEALDENSKAFRVLIGTILSHRTRDEKTEIATDALLAKFPYAESIAGAPLDEIEKLIKPVGFYRSKSVYVKKCCGELLGRFGGVVPKTMEALTSLTGVGRKTAGCVIVYAHGLASAIPVDSHVHQVSNRVGLVKTKTPEQTELALMKTAPTRMWPRINELFVLHGQKTCVPSSPFCSRCPLADYCPRIGVKNSR